jgi:bifunctional non-homologous end joining protein LigD
MPRTKLAAYRAKRNFEKTKEPSGRSQVGPAEYPRFVVQKHAARRLHYDLRLEHAGVFKSWAVTKGPSLDPADKRLAVEVEDHPLDYGDFEGTIPEGEYGAGTVMLWDRGFWMPEGTGDVDRALRKGELKFTLAGEKLKGSWVLVRMRFDREGRARINWLLIKHRGDGFDREDGEPVLDQDRSVASGRTMDQIAAGKGRGPKPFMAPGTRAKDPRAIWHSNRSDGRTKRGRLPSRPLVSASASKRSKTPTEMPRFVPPQLCTTVSRAPQGDDWVHEIKFDGYRLQLRVENGHATLLTRKGLDWTDKFRAIARAATSLPDVLIDGEVVALAANGASDFAALQAVLSERSQDLIYFAFDLLFADGEDLRAQSLSQRKRRLKELIDERKDNLIRYVEHLPGPGDAVLRSACRMNLEGIISKRQSAPYESGRTGTWTKAKCRAGHEVVIGGWTGGKTALRSLIVGVYRGDHLVYVGRVGTGFNARNSKGLLKRLKAVAADQSPFAGEGAPRKQADWTWVEPRLVAEIEFAGWTGSGLVRQAAFKGLREDKPSREVRAEHAMLPDRIEPAEPLPSGRGKRTRMTSSAPTNVVMGVTVSKPDKDLWPAEKGSGAFTKLDLALYLETVGPWMIEHLRGRPCSIIRMPDGIHEDRFFQRHVMPGMSHLVEQTLIEDERKPYLQIDRVEGLIAMAQIAAVEFHPWNCAPFHPAMPGRLIFDLDPDPEVAFTEVIAAAKELRERLEGLDLVAFCKTTGGKGLHVVTPLKVKADSNLGWKEAKAFAQSVCAAMAADSPHRYLINMSKKRRKGRIFLDYLRNDRMSTAVAPLSPRGRPGAPVSMPLNWGQVRDGLDPARFTIANAWDLLRKSKAWRDYGASQRPLGPAVRKLVGRKG